MTTPSPKSTPPTEAPAVRVKYGDAFVECAPGETVLEGLLRAEIDVPYSCRNGTCITCISRAVRGRVPAIAQQGIKDTLRAQGYFLPCTCIPTEALEIAPPKEADLFGRAVIKTVDYLSEKVCRIRLEPANPLYYRAGQFINLRREDGLIRSFSIASVPALDPFIEVHVKCLPGGDMSNWIYNVLNLGASVDIQGPHGKCFYLPGQPTQPLLLIGNGAGLAPLLGIARDAINDGHSGAIHLYHGTQYAAGLYMDEALQELDKEHENFFYNGCLSREEQPGKHHGRAEDIAFSSYADLSGWGVYLCGYPPTVVDGQRRAFHAGATLSDIHINAFELRDLRTEPRE